MTRCPKCDRPDSGPEPVRCLCAGVARWGRAGPELAMNHDEESHMVRALANESPAPKADAG